jgi:transcriptional regulator with XRE-family HTH domain
MHVPSAGVTENRWWQFVQAALDERGWTASELARRAGFERSITARWKAGGEVTVTNARKVAGALQMPLIRVLVPAGILTDDEVAGVDATDGPTLDQVTDDDLLAEIRRRFHRTAPARPVPTAAVREANPGKYIVIDPNNADQGRSALDTAVDE